MMKVYVLPADVFGCGHYRLIWPSDVLRQNGFNVVVMPPTEKSGFEARTAMVDGVETLVSVRVPSDADVMVLQRPSHTMHVQMINLLRQNGVAVVVDMDDDMSNIHPNNAAYREYDPRSSSPFSWRNAIAACKAATLVTTSTPSLQRVYAGHGRGVVLNNYVPEAYLDFSAAPERRATIGWAGTVASHPDDLQVIGDGLARLAAEGHDVRIVGDGKRCREFLRLSEDPPYTGTVGLADWVRTIAQNFGVGMVPLASTAFNTSKSRLKGIEMMSVGVPFVCSPREQYRTLLRESGCGLSADTPREWYRQLKRLLTDDALYADQVAAGREYMKTQTYQLNAWRWAEAWEKAVTIQKSM